MPSTTAQNDAMREFFDRRHPGYLENLPHWRFLDACYRGGRDWFYENIFRYFKEGEKEFDKRVERAYRFNHTREVVELVQKYLFKGEITRNTADAPDVVTQFWQKAMRGGASIDQLMRLVSVNNSTGGRVAIVVDNNFQGEVEVAEGVTRPVSIAEAKEQNFRIYAYTVPVKDILDFAYDEDGDGELLWVKLREVVRDDKDPFYSSGELVERVRLWTRTGWGTLSGDGDRRDDDLQWRPHAGQEGRAGRLRLSRARLRAGLFRRPHDQRESISRHRPDR
ncbi:hypothetical protein U8P73_36490 (plasmid) [Rhizobium beringeri]|uniref:hypothetical protein n=1 Tax=Rhizobium beringeri TaxID=3019934 RepID=UPI002DDCFBB2|nr:hypothetical protein [Rhizobium beringeri]WSG93472.1 hypothetical protein U8P73_36490 [Rhizobium beringeri]